MHVTARQVNYLPVLSNQTAQKAIAFSQSVENILMELEDFIQFTRLTRKVGHVLNVTWVILNVFHKLDQLSLGDSFAATSRIRNGVIQRIRDAAHSRTNLLGALSYFGL